MFPVLSLTYDGISLFNSHPTTDTVEHTYKSGIGHQGADYTKTDKSSPGTSLKVTRRQTTLSEYVCACVCA